MKKFNLTFIFNEETSIDTCPECAVQNEVACDGTSSCTECSRPNILPCRSCDDLNEGMCDCVEGFGCTPFPTEPIEPKSSSTNPLVSNFNARMVNLRLTREILKELDQVGDKIENVFGLNENQFMIALFDYSSALYHATIHHLNFDGEFNWAQLKPLYSELAACFWAITYHDQDQANSSSLPDLEEFELDIQRQLIQIQPLPTQH